MGGSLSTLRDVVRQMHTIQRKVVIYTTLGIVGYLLLWKYSCFISGTENSIEMRIIIKKTLLCARADLNEQTLRQET